MPTPAALFGLIIFGVIGLAAFLYGKKAALWKPTSIGLVLMVYPYFVEQTWVLYAIGGGLCVALLLFRE
ncbi:MAG: hypothetical protein P4L92_18385 [Rudaea sp.]|nr:hypothetical protein [Rudaea sp.]